MTAEWRLFAALAAFLAVSATIYWFVSYEEAGTAMLGLAAPAVGLIAVWLAVQGRKRERERDVDGQAGRDEVLYFPASSIWPLVCAAGAVVAANALVFGVWLAVTGGALLTIGIIGYAAEASSKA